MREGSNSFWKDTRGHVPIETRPLVGTGEIHHASAAAQAVKFAHLLHGCFRLQSEKIVSSVNAKAFESRIEAGSFYLRDSLCEGWLYIRKFAPSVPVVTGALP